MIPVFFLLHIWCDVPTITIDRKCARKILERCFVTSEKLFCSQGINKAFRRWLWITAKKLDMDSEPQSDYQNSCVIPCCDKYSMVLGQGGDSDNCLALRLSGYLSMSVSTTMIDCIWQQLWAEKLSREVQCCSMATVVYYKFICVLSRCHLLIHCETPNLISVLVCSFGLRL